MVVFSPVDEQLNQANISVLPFISLMLFLHCVCMRSLVDITNNVPPPHEGKPFTEYGNKHPSGFLTHYQNKNLWPESQHLLMTEAINILIGNKVK